MHSVRWFLSSIACPSLTRSITHRHGRRDVSMLCMQCMNDCMAQFTTAEVSGKVLTRDDLHPTEPCLAFDKEGASCWIGVAHHCGCQGHAVRWWSTFTRHRLPITWALAERFFLFCINGGIEPIPIPTSNRWWMSCDCLLG